MTGEAYQQLVDALKQSPKYRYACDETLDRIARWALARYASPKEALKAAKRKLHQVYGAYFEQAHLQVAMRLLDALPPRISEKDALPTCRRILELHASTAERLPIMADAFRASLARMGRIDTVLDLACGVNPFSIPWMHLPADTRYLAWDMDRRLPDLINGFLHRIGRAGEARCSDLLVSAPDIQADIVLLLKTLPCIEQQEKGASLRLLHRIRARRVVISFPAMSLCGRRKGMPGHYDRFMQRMCDALAASAQRHEYPTEVFYVLDSPSAGGSEAP